mgnify:CR=1 FL=1
MFRFMEHEPDKDAAEGPSYQNPLLRFRERLQDDRTVFRRAERRWSWVRLAAFVLGLVTVILLRDRIPLAAAAGAVGLVLFVLAIVRHTHWEGRRVSTEHTLTVTDESLRAAASRDEPARDWQRPADSEFELPEVIETGPTWELTGQERNDLDVYGPPVGVFGLLNRTSTDLGARRLRDALDHPCLSAEAIRSRQQAVQWLADRDELRLSIMATLVPLRSRSGRLDDSVRLLHETRRPPASSAYKAIRLWSILSGLLFIYGLAALVDGQMQWARVIVVLLVVNNLILMAFRRKLRRSLAAVSPWTPLSGTLSRFLAIARHASGTLPDETELHVLKAHFHRVVHEARVPSLCTWLEWAGLHGLVRSLLNMIVLLDLHIAEAVLARIVPNREVLLNGLASLAELEVLCSLASFSAECRRAGAACWPEPTVETGVAIREGRHPLLLPEEAVPNDARLTGEKRTWIVTGPNAAGKSTFLRMVGVNVLLAQIGLAVPAIQMVWSPVRLLTDVRIRDDLARHESYFLTEVRRLRRLVLDAEATAPMLGLIDEPFRGTNSQERTAAGIALLEHLMGSHNLFLIATHEEVLARIAAEAPTGENYHFQEHLQDGGIRFDYLLRPGPATTRTAIRILEQEGYPQSLLERARRLMTGGEQPPQSSG